MVRASYIAFCAAQLSTNMLYLTLYMNCDLTLKGTLIEKMIEQLQKDSKIVLGFMYPINCTLIDCKLIENVIDNRGT